MDAPLYESKSLLRAEVLEEASLEGLLDWKYLSLGGDLSALRFLAVGLDMSSCRAFGEGPNGLLLVERYI